MTTKGFSKVNCFLVDSLNQYTITSIKVDVIDVSDDAAKKLPKVVFLLHYKTNGVSKAVSLLFQEKNSINFFALMHILGKKENKTLKDCSDVVFYVFHEDPCGSGSYAYDEELSVKSIETSCDLLLPTVIWETRRAQKYKLMLHPKIAKAMSSQFSVEGYNFKPFCWSSN